MLRNTSSTSRFMKRAVLSLALCGGLTLGQSAGAQERGLLAEESPGAFNAAGQAAKDTGPGPVEGFSLGGEAQVQGQVGQPLEQGQVIEQGQAGLPGQPLIQDQPVLQGQPVPQGQAGQLGLPGQPGFAAPHGVRQGMQLGVQVEAHEEGLRVVSVREDSAAKKAGLKEGDIIKRFNDQDVRDAQSLQSQISQMQAGSEAQVVVMRDDEEQTLTAKFEENRYSAARPALDDSLRAELEALRAEVKELRSELHSLKQQQQDSSAAPVAPETPDAAVENRAPEAAESAPSDEAAEAEASEQEAESSEAAEEAETAEQ